MGAQPLIESGWLQVGLSIAERWGLTDRETQLLLGLASHTFYGRRGHAAQIATRSAHEGLYLANVSVALDSEYPLADSRCTHFVSRATLT